VNRGETLFLADTPNAIRSNATPTTGNWSTAYVIGEADVNITAMVVTADKVFIIKEDGVYYINTAGTVVNAAPSLKAFRATNAGKNSCVWNEKIYIPMGQNALIEYDPANDSWENISPALTQHSASATQTGGTLTSSILTSFDGKIWAVGGGTDWLWALQENGTKNTLFKGQYASIDGIIGWAWHPVAEQTQGDANCIGVSNLTGVGFIWVGHGTGNPGYWNLSKYETAGTKYFTTPWFTGGVRHMLKEAYQLIVGAEDVDADDTISLSWRKYGDADFTAIAGAITSLTRGEASKYMPSNSFATAWQFKVTLANGANTTSPKLTYFKAEGKIKPSEVKVFDFTTDLIDNQMQKNGVGDGVLASRKETCLDNVVASNWPVTFYDLDGATHSVDVLSREQVGVRQEYGRNKVKRFHVLAQKVTLA